jgi:hypothetical protein
MSKAKDELLDALSWEDVNRILRKHSENRGLYACVRIVSVGAFIAAFVYVDTMRGAFPSFFAFVTAFRTIQLPSIVKLDRYARDHAARAAA